MWYKTKKFWAGVLAAIVLIVSYFREELGGLVQGVGTALLNAFFAAALVVGLATMPACSWLSSALPAVVTAVTRAATVIDTIDQFVDIFFAEHPNEKLQNVVDEALLRARAALSAVSHAGSGAEKARIEFEKAYAELLKVVAPLGIAPAGEGDPLSLADESLASGGAVLLVPSAAEILGEM